MARDLSRGRSLVRQAASRDSTNVGIGRVARGTVCEAGGGAVHSINCRSHGWFRDAYASWRKGAVENVNGRLRHDLPRRLDMDRMSDEDLADIDLMHNLTPRKCLRFSTPAQELLSQLSIDATFQSK